MAKVIWKYEIPLLGEFKIAMSKGARILKVATQYDNPVMWALVDDAAEKETRKFVIVGTGQRINQGACALNYIDTFLEDQDRFVWHLFEATDIFGNSIGGNT
jgi:hypothetical protein